MKVVYYRGDSRRSRIVGDAVLEGLKHHGVHDATWRYEQDYAGPEADVAVFYGLAGKLKQAQRDYVAAGLKAVFVDLGYWGRLEDGKAYGFHRVVVNGLHATAYFQRVRHPRERFMHFGIEPRRFSRTGRRVVLCGMSAKAAWVYDLEAEQWERQAVAHLMAATKREVHYRPKPSWREAQPINGASWRLGKPGTIDDALEGAWACVTHHGNSALDALIAGVPVFCEEGLASVLASRELAAIERPQYPDERARDQLLFDAAYTQYKVSEIAEGKMWRYLRDEGLI